MKFIVTTPRTKAVIEADNLEDAEQKANVRYPSWEEIRYQNINFIKN